uniref:NADH dehydrogenase subunit 6 n=1 Tax=Tigrigobius multifasciatus TaxID=203335 RepID=UPI0028FC7D79|nr:NADH dehydrogenase subunit 6 [Tigrigobius multifasciatus]WNH38014.1 NADH dehydrogenase subunit 6 [Tigrigobius multifasciatus]
MFFLVKVVIEGLLFAMAALSSNPSPLYGAFAIVTLAGLGCALVSYLGGSFLCLVLFLIYLGGMLVVFAFAAALATEKFPKIWANPGSFGDYLAYVVALVFMIGYYAIGLDKYHMTKTSKSSEMENSREDQSGVALMYSIGWALLIIGVGVLLVTLIIILNLVRGGIYGALRAI